MTIKEYLKNNILITDGAMGTYYSEIVSSADLIPEYANITNPELIKKIHLEYIKAGADIIRTNTFAANSYTFMREYLKEESKYENTLDYTENEYKSAENKVYECIKAAVKIAKSAVKTAKEIMQQAVDLTNNTENNTEIKNDKAIQNNISENIFIAGDIGPIIYKYEAEEEEIFNEYKFIADNLINAGVDLILMETFPDTYYQLKLAEYIKQKQPDMFIMAEISIGVTGYAASGVSGKKLLNELAENKNIDAYGLNCGIGSGHMLDFVKKLSLKGEKYFCAAPNAGYPEQIKSRMVFINNAEYFADNAVEFIKYGTSVIGACCGSNPNYIKTIKSKITEAYSSKNILLNNNKDILLSKKENSNKNILSNKQEPNDNAVIQAEKKPVNTMTFIEKLYAGIKVTACELDPPYDADDSKIIASALKLKDSGKPDIITFADSPRGKSRVDSIHMANKIKNITGMSVMPHICCRDKNMIAMRSQLLGAYVNGIRNLLIVTGDPVPGEARINTTSVFDYNSIKLMSYIKAMNEEHFIDDKFIIGGALNYAGKNPDAIADRMKRKMEAGAEFFLSQPVYSDSDIERIYLLKEKTNARILCGIMPLISYRNAIFIKNEIAGINIPDEIVKKYSPDMSRQEAENTAAEISNNIIKKLSGAVNGYYIMLQFNRAGLMDLIKIE